MAEIVNITSINPFTFEEQAYSFQDEALITSIDINTSFNPNTDLIEYYVYDLNGDIVFQNNTGWPSYQLLDNVLVLDPESDLKSIGFDEGQYNTLYNFASPKMGSSALDRYFISQISPDRTEVRLDTTDIPNDVVVISSLELINNINTSTGSYYDFYLNFDNNQSLIAVNALLDTSSIDNPTVLIKLYEALPQEFDVNSQCWVVTQIAEPVAYNVNITQVFDILEDNIPLRGPNTNISLQDQIANSTPYSNLTQLNTTNQAQGTGSLQYQLNSMLAQTGIEINVDYSDYVNFIHFSSAQTRLENFYYKLSLLEQYQYSASLSSGTLTNTYVSSSNLIWQAKIDEIITGFDDYEYYLYYNSGSSSWPKTNSTPPYTNVTTGSVAGQTWFVSQSAVAEEYDILNNNALINAIPSYLLEDPENAQYELFVEMIGQYFDTVFLYTQDITNKYNADNRVNYGVSKDLVADILRDMGIKIYQNNFSTNDLYSALLGFTPSGSLYNLPYTTGSLPTPTGYEYINTYVTASATGSLVPTEDINAEIYKRIYANLPYLLKKKGTVEGLKALVTLYGIPDTILQVNEFGGQNEIDENDYDLWFDQFNYAYNAGGSQYITSSWETNPLFGTLYPQTIQFRFQTRGIPTDTGYYSQSLWTTDAGVLIRLRYTGSGYTSGSYSGSIPDPYNEYAHLDFIPDISTPSLSASVYLPFFNGDWWNVMATGYEFGNIFKLYAGNKTTPGGNYNTYQFLASSSVSTNEVPWDTSVYSYFPSLTNSSFGKMFSGSYQEIRYYNEILTVDPFEDYIMYPYSIDANGINTAPDTLIFRATLGGELYTASLSIHPKVTGSWATTSSFPGNDNSFYLSSTDVFVDNKEFVYPNQFPAGIKNRVSNKIRQQNEVLPYSGSEEVNLPQNTALSPFISVQQDVPESGSYTPNIDYVEVAFSPQNEINNDIAGQLGYFNIGEYIGDPRLVSSSAESYPALDGLRNYYFEKYTGNYNIWDYIRLIKYFDNSLFKMIQDWVPARTSLASGIVIKQTTLERNKYPVPQLNTYTTTSFYGSGSVSNISWNTPFVTEDLLITGSPIQIAEVQGTNGGTMPDLFGLTSSEYTGNNVVNITQVWTGSTPSLLGPVVFTESAQYEFFNGELSGSTLQVENGELNEANPYKLAPTQIIQYQSTGSSDTNPGPGQFYWTSSLSYNGTGWGRAVQYIYINEIDNNGINIQPALSNLNPGNKITFRIFGNYTNDGGLIFSFYTDYTLTGVIQSISPVSPSVYRIQLSTTSNIAATYINFGLWIPGDPNYIDYPGVVLGTVSLDPFLNATSGFDNSEYNPLINNAVLARPNDNFFDVDFSSNAITAVNRNVIISASRGTGSATPSTVPASNYTTARITNPRYNGSRTTSPTGSLPLSYVNQPMVTGSSIGAVANVEDYCNWFGYFDNISPTKLSADLEQELVSVLNANVTVVHLTALINVNGEKIELSPTNNSYTVNSGSLFIGGGNIIDNPLTSNIPFLNTIYPSNLGAVMANSPYTASNPTPVYIQQYNYSGSSPNVNSGSFQTYQVITSGVAPTSGSGFNPLLYRFEYVYGLPNETLVILRTGSFVTPTGNINGLLIPGNFNPKYKENVLAIAQSAGFFNNI